jgi:two-component system, cell cycle sensor histidine kinase and response regulator CckA
VLLVEDEESVRALSRRALERAGFTVLEAAHPEAALKVASAHTGGIDLIVSDVVMPGMSGRMMVERLAHRYPQARVLFMSGYTDTAVTRTDGCGDGPTLLQKPFTPNTLIRRVRDIMETPAPSPPRTSAGRLHEAVH